MERNPNHEPAGSSTGGQFTSGKGNAAVNDMIRKGAGRLSPRARHLLEAYVMFGEFSDTHDTNLEEDVHTLEGAAASQFGGKVYVEGQRIVPEIGMEDLDAIQELYDYTQKNLPEKMYTLYRGIGKGHGLIENDALTSWTDNIDIARDFGEVQTMHISRKKILASWHNFDELAAEHEFLVLAGTRGIK